MENLFEVKIKFNFLYNNKELRRKKDGKETKKREKARRESNRICK